ncbi:MAG: hypoxanthine-guanine phosphoribosyltransferase [Alcanivoracaceae bacterium]|nr:hypoxanthine-guanine phosphoribosyltransferase [Alcanivoracaceae bacterium]
MSQTLLEHMQQVRDNARELYNMAQVDAAITRLANELTGAYSDKNPLLLTVMNGGVVLAGKLVPQLPFPLEMDYLHATRYRGETSGGNIEWIVTPTTPMLDRHIIILDDILDVGSTLVSIIEACKAQGAASVATCVLVDKKHDRKAVPGLKADFTGLVAEDAYLFGCGMDYKNYWRNAPGIYAVEGT